MKRHARHRRSIVALSLAVLLACCAVAVSRAQEPKQPQAGANQNVQSPDAVKQQLTEQAAKGQFDAMKTYDALVKSGMSKDDANAATDAIQAAYNKTQNDQKYKDDAAAKKKEDEAKKKADDAKNKDQNASGGGDWNFGQVYRDRDYDLTMPVTNSCRMAQTVTITYPTEFMMQGPGSVVVPAKSKVDVAMKLILTQPPMPMPPWPPGVNMSCYDLGGALTLVHPELKQFSKTATGTYTYVCHAMKKTYQLQMHVHQHGPPQPPPQPPGGGGACKNKTPVCTTYWNHAEFYPSTTTHSPAECTDEVRDEAHAFFGSALDSLRAKDPRAWAWVPSAADIDTMSASDLVALKARADAQAGRAR